jgi:single-strand DNA-binding protein
MFFITEHTWHEFRLRTASEKEASHMYDVNRITLVGRLGKAPVQRETKNGRPVANFPVATSRFISNDNGDENSESTEKKEETQWHNIVVWNKMAETCTTHLKKGERVFVEGSLRSHQYEDKEGKMQRSYEVYADRVIFLGGGNGSKEKH